MNHILSKSLVVGMTTLVLTACGGGGGSTSTFTPPPVTPPPTTGGNNNDVWVAGQFPDESTFEAKCATPRSGTDPFTGQPYPDQAGSAMDEKMWLRSWSNNTYLWYDEITDEDPTPFGVTAYFDRLRTNERTDSGSFKDNFHFFQDTAEYNEQTQGGTTSGYGISWEFVRTSPPRQLIVRYTQPNSPAALAGLQRGAEIVSIDGVDFVNGNDVNTINAGLFPATDGEEHTLVVRNADETEQTIVLTSAEFETSPVHHANVLETTAGTVGYLQFNTFSSNRSLAQTQLFNAFQSFADANINELVVDLRYNGGGLLAVASQLAFMVAGEGQTNGQTFEQLQFNDKHPRFDPVTGNALSPTPFYSRQIDWDAGVFTSDLPSVNLSRVYVLATDSTCSASEAFINGLRGIDIEVVLVGSTTCGKPYGFYPTDNCGTTYFTIQFEGVNNKGFGAYSDGFVPTETPTFAADVQGCEVADDFSNALGSTDEAMLAAALQHAQDGSCPAVVKAKPVVEVIDESNKHLAIKKPNTVYDAIIMENKIYQPIKQ